MNHFGIFDSIQAFTNITRPFVRTSHKERVETILEPLQGIVQLAILSKCPIHTKLAIKHNALSIQLPLLHQGVIRWYNNDKKDDLVYIFNIIKRFRMFYKKIFQSRPQLYNLLTQMASQGLIQLQKTYDFGMNVTLVQTLKMYDSILLGNIDFELFDNECDVVVTRYSDGDSDSFHSANSVDSKRKNSEEENIIIDTNSVVSSTTQEMHSSDDSTINIEKVFYNITKIYPNELYDILYNLFVLLDKDEIKYNDCLTIVEALYKPYNKKIYNWINKHLIF